jgi:hypothetical protein
MLPEHTQLTPEQILRLERNPNLYARLGLEPGASRKDIEDAALTLKKRFHPDTHPDESQLYTRASQLISEAEVTLTNERAYIRWCATHGIPIDKFPIPPAPAEVVVSLDGESFPGALSRSVLSEDPHLHYDIEFMIARMPEVLADAHLYLAKLFQFQPHGINGDKERRTRAAQHPRLRPYIEPLLEKALSDDDALQRVHQLTAIFGIGPKEYPKTFAGSIVNRCKPGKGTSADELFRLLEWVRREAPEIFALPEVSRGIAAYSKQMAVQKELCFAEAVKLVADVRQTPEQIYTRIFPLAKSKEDFNICARYLVAIPNVEEFLNSPSGPAELGKIIVKAEHAASILHWRKSGISQATLSKALITILPTLLKKGSTVQRFMAAVGPILPGVADDGAEVNNATFDRSLLTPEISAELDAFLEIHIAKVGAKGNLFLPQAMRQLIRFFNCSGELIIARAKELLTPPVSFDAAKGFLKIFEAFPEVRADSTVLEAIDSRPRPFSKWDEERLTRCLEGKEPEAGATPKDDED